MNTYAYEHTHIALCVYIYMHKYIYIYIYMCTHICMFLYLGYLFGASYAEA